MRSLRSVSEQASGRLAATWRVVRRAASSFGEAARRLRGSTWAMPLVKITVCAAGLFLFAWFGQRATAHVGIPPAAAAVDIAPVVPIMTAAPPSSTLSSTTAPPGTAPPMTSRATADSPVILNTATLEDLQRLPGIGPKRARAILDQRARQGRFRQIEDLMKVKGVGRKTISRLRPLVRLDSPVDLDASAG